MYNVYAFTKVYCYFPSIISVMEWDRFTLDIISTANKVLVDGRPIRAYFDKCLTKMINDLMDQANVVDQALKLRVDEYQEVIKKLKHQKIEVRYDYTKLKLCSTYVPLCAVYNYKITIMRFNFQTMKKIEDVQETITKLKKGIDDKEAYISLVHTRLLNRTRREGVELCRDELEIKLYDEVVELENSVKNLNKMMADSSTCLRHLKQTTIRIDIQLDVKQNSLHIDNELCVEQRKRINYRAF